MKKLAFEADNLKKYIKLLNVNNELKLKCNNRKYWKNNNYSRLNHFQNVEYAMVHNGIIIANPGVIVRMIKIKIIHIPIIIKM